MQTQTETALIRPTKADLARIALDRWHDDPSRFAADVFDFRPWSRQRDIFSATARYDRVSIRSGHKCGKSASVAILALWWLLTRKDASVILLAPTYKQIERIVWREIKNFYHRKARIRLGGEAFTKPEEGIRLRDGRQLFGFSTDKKENAAGHSGNIIYILDEASGIDDEVHEVVSTSPAGKVVMISNPTRSEGAFYRSHHAERDVVWKCLHISSEEAARENKIITLSTGERRPLIRGLATTDWVETQRVKYGEDSYFYDVRVRGDFSKQSDRAVIPLGVVQAAIDAWPTTPREGRLNIGVDVARFGTDDSCIVWRRGKWASVPIVFHGSDNVRVAGEVLRVVSEQRQPGEKPIIRVDTSGLGAGVADILRAQKDELSIEVVDVQAQESSTNPEFSRRRDQVWFSLLDWMRSGGASPEDPRLSPDLLAPLYDVDERGRRKVESKRDLHKRLQRSTDRADALALAVFDDFGEPDNSGDIFDAFKNTPKSAW